MNLTPSPNIWIDGMAMTPGKSTTLIQKRKLWEEPLFENLMVYWSWFHGFEKMYHERLAYPLPFYLASQ